MMGQRGVKSEPEMEEELEEALRVFDKLGNGYVVTQKAKCLISQGIGTLWHEQLNWAVRLCRH